MSQKTLCALQVITQLGIDTAKFEQWKINNLRPAESQVPLENELLPKSSTYESTTDYNRTLTAPPHSGK